MIFKKKNIFFYSLAMLCAFSICDKALGIAEKSDSLKKDVDASKTDKKHESKVFLTLYDDLALIEKHDFFDLDKTIQTISFLNLPKETLEKTLFLTSKGQTLEFLESFFEESDIKKDYHITVKNKSENSSSEVSLTFACTNITWKPYYSAKFSKDFEMLSLEGWIDIENQTNARFKDATLSIINNKSAISMDNGPEKSAPNQHADKANDVYLIGKNITLKEKSKKRFKWIKYDDMKTIKEYRLNMGGGYLEDLTNKDETPQLELWINCPNKEKALLQGPLTIYKNGLNDGQVETLTEIVLPFVKKDEMISFKMPSIHEDCHKAVPVKVAYEQTEFQKFTGKIVETANRITFQNVSEQLLSIKVFINFPSSDGVVLRESVPHQTEGGGLFWVMDIPAGEKIDLKYRLRFSQAL
ncbi:MAG: hypothetical protein KBD31_05310 [Proteobacteria bacterium]|nr:hypothetical protein [Pseudomonadota bacterium]